MDTTVAVGVLYPLGVVMSPSLLAMFIAMAMAMSPSPVSVIGNALRLRHQRLPGE
jgi:Cu+-exporting ATPase